MFGNLHADLINQINHPWIELFGRDLIGNGIQIGDGTWEGSNESIFGSLRLGDLHDGGLLFGDGAAGLNGGTIIGGEAIGDAGLDGGGTGLFGFGGAGGDGIDGGAGGLPFGGGGGNGSACTGGHGGAGGAQDSAGQAGTNGGDATAGQTGTDDANDANG